MLCRRVSFTEQTRLEHAIKSENVAELSAVLDGGASPNTLILQVCPNLSLCFDSVLCLLVC